MRPDYSPGLPADAPYYMGDYCDDYHINDVAWFGGTGETAETIVFREGRIYTLQLFLTAKDGYQFVNATTATVNGVVPNVVQMYEDQLKIQYTFPRLPYAFNGTVEFDPSDVQFKGTTPYVVYNGAYMTPRVIVKDVDGNVLDQLEYTVAYKENRNPGTAYVVVTIPGMNAVAHAFFKIYMPPTTTTTVANVNDGVKITWKAVPDAAGYVIYRRAWNLSSSGWTTFERWNNTTATTWTDTKVYAGTRYQYGVKAYFAQRTDPVSGAVIGGAMDNYNLGIVGPLKTTVRITTRTLNSVTGGTKQITVKWSGSSVFTGYQVQIATDSAFTQNKKTVTISDAKTVQTTIKNLKAKTNYYVRVRSYHVFEGTTYYGGWSNVLSAKTK